VRLVWQNVLSTVIIARLAWKPVKDALRLVKCKSKFSWQNFSKEYFAKSVFKF